jgi:hypothetical protein
LEFRDRWGVKIYAKTTPFLTDTAFETCKTSKLYALALTIEITLFATQKANGNPITKSANGARSVNNWPA